MDPAAPALSPGAQLLLRALAQGWRALCVPRGARPEGPPPRRVHLLIEGGLREVPSEDLELLELRGLAECVAQVWWPLDDGDTCTEGIEVQLTDEGERAARILEGL